MRLRQQLSSRPSDAIGSARGREPRWKEQAKSLRLGPLPSQRMLRMRRSPGMTNALTAAIVIPGRAMPQASRGEGSVRQQLSFPAERCAARARGREPRWKEQAKSLRLGPPSLATHAPHAPLAGDDKCAYGSNCHSRPSDAKHREGKGTQVERTSQVSPPGSPSLAAHAMHAPLAGDDKCAYGSNCHSRPSDAHRQREGKGTQVERTSQVSPPGSPSLAAHAPLAGDDSGA